ncbi:heavy metal translocating P-type ATPase [Lactococcus termiticola]|uniref:Cd(2+)-exporting ATPase n=1 Tax=Lactococcus termiticola TaxID=2169526 RepID=A0A2R5HFR1_9LACT|nr:heavy metal translocating P-type ATPase [Lactococcus termiticola]GBG96903.1 cation-transporting ATPase [Lactococcus termiticola]
MKNWQKLVLVFAIAIAALLAEFVFKAPLVSRGIVTVAGGVLALSMFWEMIKTLRSGSYGVDLLAITAIIATLLVGEYWASLIIILMLVGGESLEDYAAGRANRELSSLLEQSPDIAHVKASEQIKDMALDEIAVGTTLVVRPLEVIPIDGILLSAAASLNEASVTGESKPNELVKGDNVMSGAINGNNSIEVQTTVPASESQFQKIISLVKEAESTPANFVRLADRYAVPFTIIAYIIAAVAYFISGNPVRIAEVLVVASPCPLILAAPIAFVSGMSRSSKNGFLIKNGQIIEKLAVAKSIFFDKTGTITDGELEVEAVKPVEAVSEEELLAIVYALEKESNHILAKALVAYVEKGDIPNISADRLAEVPGMGVEAMVNGSDIKIGRASFVDAPKGLDYETAFYVSRDDQYIGAVTFSDQIRENAAEAINRLRKLGINEISMLTGDNERVAQKIAAEVNISNVHASLLPDEKLAAIQSAEHKPTIMVGDGINDAPALALADVGIAVGVGGATAASEAADLVLLKNDINCVPTAVTISRDTMKIARQAVLIGIIICIILMLIAVTGLIPAIIGALFQEVIDVVSILYALRALRG